MSDNNKDQDGKYTITSHIQSGEIIARKWALDLTPKPEFRLGEGRQDRSPNGQIQTILPFTVITLSPVANLYLQVNGNSIKELHVNPMGFGSGVFITGQSGNRPTFAYTNIPQAKGDYQMVIISTQPEQFGIQTEL